MKNVKGAVDHLKNHQSYPAKKEELMAECDNLSDFSDEDKKWYAEHLTKDNYESAEEIMMDLGLEETVA